MFSSAFKSIASTNINANYSVAPTPISTAGPWKIYDAKKKSTGKPCSIFVFDRKALDAHGSSLGRSGAAAFRRSTDEVVERLRKEATSLAKLRHPSILELVEPVEDTRGGGLQFATEPVTASLAGLLQEKDEQERSGGPGGKSSRFVTEDSDGVRRRRELEIDELEIQKGLLQISKALEFLHDNAGLVHGNLTPDAVLVNAKSDWKLSGLAFCSPPDNSSKPTSIQPISLSEAMNLDPRLPRTVQLNLDYTSPDFVLDTNLSTSADMFSLGLVAIALYNSPHRSPLQCNGSLSAYKRLFASSSTVPCASNDFLSARKLPRDIAANVLPRLITRRPAQRMTAREFQQSEYFDNILVSTIRFLDAFPAKTPTEKAQFMRGLNKVLPSFPKSVMEKKILPALLEEVKDKELLSLILQNVFKIMDLLPSARRAFGDRVRPILKEVFVTNAKQTQEKDAARDAGLMIVLENLASISSNCGGKEFKDDVLPIILAAMESPTPSVVDAALRCLDGVLPVLDFSTIKNELFPVVAAVFSKTTSLAIKIRGLEAFVVLCGGSAAESSQDGGLSGIVAERKTSSSSALDKYTMQEKIIPLVKAIKTKEPAVMVAALNVIRIVGQIADADFVAMDILPILWTMSLGPLLNLQQFQTFMELIKALSRRVEEEQTKKLQELAGTTDAGTAAPHEDFLGFGGLSGTAFDASAAAAATNGDDTDFEKLVKGNSAAAATVAGGAASGTTAGWDETFSGGSAARSAATSPMAVAFAWSTPSPTGPIAHPPPPKPFSGSAFRTVTPDLSRFDALTPSSTQFSQPLQPTHRSVSPQPAFVSAAAAVPPSSLSGIDWSNATKPAASSSPWATLAPSQPAAGAAALTSSMSSVSLGAMGGSFGGGTFSLSQQPQQQYQQQQQQRPSYGQTQSSSSSFSLPPPPSAAPSLAGFSIAPPGNNGWAVPGTQAQPAKQQQQQQQQQQSGLDKYASLL